jgi:hypothetical protein
VNGSFIYKRDRSLLGKSNEILVIGVDVGELNVRVEEELVFGDLFALAELKVYDSFGFLAQTWVSSHLLKNRK